MTELTPLHAIAQDILENARAANMKIATAESCTGGLVGAALTEIDGASAVFDRGFITYSNEAKIEMLGVPQDMLREHGAVSAVVAKAMAEGALLRSQANIAVSITGIAGPQGGSVDKPVGLVHFAISSEQAGTSHFVRSFSNSGRSSIRMNAAGYALEIVSNAIYSIRGISIA
ncbi:nicotinamide-nucleotide amidase [Breoghania corrubedonensis]|uniref:Nicotinamide-nucleotide amidase n=1 Tax=Breoghania corrubedonensis TaxID=665038 RepID=A0A2T5V927_9HYPH|nr:nicotinamide-nucleotide amidohydrolase family protein [Breoghania corrubedonensis]PTW60257.1 nicotinamide-nucleotide amidase [Breoghania corrubedonensis]